MESSKKEVENLLGAALIGRLNSVKLLIEDKGVDVNSSNADGLTALHRAAAEGYDSIVEYLISKGANVNCKTESGDPEMSNITPLVYAVKNAHLNVAKILLEKGAKIDVIINDCTILGIAVVTNDPNMINLLLDYGADINDGRGNEGVTPLQLALGKGKYQSAQFLLDKGADYRKCSNDGFFPLHFAAKREGSEGVELLLKHTKGKEGKDKLLEYINYSSADNGRTALHIACLVKNYPSVKALLENGADYKIRDKQGLVPYRLVLGDSHVSKQIRSLFGRYEYVELCRNK